MCFVLSCVHSFVMWDSVVYIWIVFWHLGVCIPSGQQKVGKVADIKGEAEYNVFTSIIRLSEGPTSAQAQGHHLLSMPFWLELLFHWINN